MAKRVFPELGIGDKWAVLFSHPKDFTPVCTTELGTMARMKAEFDRRNTRIIGLSADPVEDHQRWAKDIEETQGAAVNYPMIGDPDLKVAKLYDMLPADAAGDPKTRTAANNATVRTVFVIGPDKKIKLMLFYPMTTGRNFDEILRALDSMQLTARHKVATPANWERGHDPAGNNPLPLSWISGRILKSKEMESDMKALRIALVLALVAGALTATSAFAHGRYHGGPRVSFGFSFGAPLYYGYPSYYYPAPIYYPAPAPIYYSAPVVIQAPPQVYTERGDVSAAPAPETQQYWHYCVAARGYYPYVKECPGGWERVPAAPTR